MSAETTAAEWHCSLGPCAAEDGHEGTCAEASGWAEWEQDEAQQYAEQAEEKDALADLQRRYGNGPTRQGGGA